jgi:hypothetical protein
MAELVYKTSFEIARPVMLDREALLKLDGILQEYWQNLNKRREESIRIEVDQEMKQWLTSYPPHYGEEETKEALRERIKAMVASRLAYAYDALSISVQFSDGTKLSVESFSEAM